MVPHGRQHPREVALPVAPAVAPQTPLHPHQGDPQHQEGGEVGDHERAAAVRGRLRREAEKVPQPDRIARHGQDEPDPGSPPLPGPGRPPFRPRAHATRLGRPGGVGVESARVSGVG